MDGWDGAGREGKGRDRTGWDGMIETQTRQIDTDRQADRQESEMGHKTLYILMHGS